MSVQFVLSTTMFVEGELREFDAAYEHAVFDDYDNACAAVDGLTTTHRSILDYLVKLDDSDGISVDVSPRIVDDDGTTHDYAIMLAAEIVPGRPVVWWHGDECHDNRHPRLER